MSYLLREVLLEALGIESDLQWGISKSELSAVDLELVPPGSGQLIGRIAELGAIYRSLDETIQTQQTNPYCQALYDSIENYLDHYRSAILQADEDINAGLLTTLTGLVAHVEPFQHELQFVGRIVPPLVAASPLEMLNKIHEYVVIGPPSMSAKLAAFEAALQQVAISQLTGFLFYHQSLPDIFERGEKITYAKKLMPTFIPQQLTHLLLLIVAVADHCNDLFDDIDPPEFDQLVAWIGFMAKTVSDVLSDRIRNMWPSYFYTLKSIILLQRFDYIQMLSRKMLQPYVSVNDMNLLFHKLSPKYDATLRVLPGGLTIYSKLKPPLDLIVTDEHQNILGDMFKLLMKLAVAEESLGDIWRAAKRKKPRLLTLIGFLYQILAVIKEHVVFVVITPGLVGLEAASADIKDFLQFQGEFAAFVLSLSASFPAMNPEFQNSINSLTDRMVEMRKMLIAQNLIEKSTEEEIFNIIATFEKEIDVGVTVIARTLRTPEDNGVNLSDRLPILLRCMKGCLRT